jgi:phospholipase/carboxylesterase
MGLNAELVPAKERDSRRLLVVLHGMGDSGAGYLGIVRELDIPWLNFLLVDAPDEYYGGFSWYDFPGEPVPGVERSRKLLGELLEGLPAKGFAADATMLFGFSQGCLMALETGLRLAQPLAGLIGVSGYVTDAAKLVAEMPAAAKSTPVLVTHGTLDPLIPCTKARAQMEAIQAAGVPLEWREFRKDHTIVAREIVLLREFITRCLKPG